MTKTIIFLAGFSIPISIAKSRFIWKDDLWAGYNRIHISSKMPRNDQGIEKELINLEKLIDSFKYPIVAGHSLGAWWLANLIVRQNVDIKKAIYFTPLSEPSLYPHLFKYSEKHDPFTKELPQSKCGKHKHLVIFGNSDLIAPPIQAVRLATHFDSTRYILTGGHYYQINHNIVLQLIKKWIELDI